MPPPPEIYLDACATAPPAAAVLEAMARAHREAWANPSSLHGHGLAAAELLERDRQALAARLGCGGDELVFVSGGSEAIHTALVGSDGPLEPGRVLLSAVEHPASYAAAAALARRGWEVQLLPVDRRGVVDLEDLQRLLSPPTRLVSVLWGQSEVGTLQPIEAIGALCRQAGVRFHVDAVQVVGHRPVDFSRLPVDLLSCVAHKLQGPRGVGALLVRRGVGLEPLIGGAQEGGRRGGTEPVALVAGFAAALELADRRLSAHGGADPMASLRDPLLADLRQVEGVRLSGPEPDDPAGRLPHHISLLVDGPEGRPLGGRRLVRELARQGYAVSSGSACASAGGAAGTAGTSAVLLAMGYGPAEAASGLRISLGSWLTAADLAGLPAALELARRRVAEAPG
ncbi:MULTISPECIES: aminotransferase class V-fold PLP-dependent enzyme [unclassified Synechococcus]|uniref:cysteine desulfurase family protein n=1 Tax=unclassified Synechococcus TaxID=2626047 RepID=UPI001C227F44|nr:MULTISPECIES: aminotransferase class V-fold PLP-dependent enzyme [unclassified Synechococcus]